MQRTSQTHPLQIAEVSVGAGLGLVGVTFAPGKKQPGAISGPWHRDLATDLDAVAAWNAAAVLTLVEPHELEALDIADIGQQVRRRHMEWHHWPIADVSVPSASFETTWKNEFRSIACILQGGSNVLVHCKGGLGRAGMIAARILVQLGTDPMNAIDAIRAVRPGAIETAPQEAWIRAGRSWSPLQPSTAAKAARDRAVGALVGLAAGDAVGTTIEFAAKPKYALIDDMVGRGPFGLKAGEWTDDTAMALALAESLLRHPEFDATDLMSRFVQWHEKGSYSCTGTCFDIGNTVRAALATFKRTGNPMAGSSDPRAAGNGALMRLAPVAVRYFADRPKLRDVAARQTQTTHGAHEAVEASVLFAEILADAISGKPRSEVLAARSGSFSPNLQAIACGDSWRGCHRDKISGTGYVVDCLNAALWAVSRTTSFRSAILLAANLGEDADTTAAVAGQLAGALYGATEIPKGWLEKLAWQPRIISTAERLLAAGLPDFHELKI